MAAYGDFTEASFRDMLRALKAGGYRFVRYGEAPEGRHVLWRHDVDFSMHRAAQLARIEAQEGATATYFLNAHCAFYNLLEPEILQLCKEIRAAGMRSVFISTRARIPLSDGHCRNWRPRSCASNDFWR
jgi:hypothetical protein